jgi:hypothetical protein
MKILLDCKKNDELIKFLLSNKKIKYVLTNILDIFSNPEKSVYLIGLNENNIYQMKIRDIKKYLIDYIQKNKNKFSKINYSVLGSDFKHIINAIYDNNRNNRNNR